jgi:hypothetical protein
MILNQSLNVHTNLIWMRMILSIAKKAATCLRNGGGDSANRNMQEEATETKEYDR